MLTSTLQGDAKALADEVADVLCAPFPEPEDSWTSQGEADALTLITRLERVASMVAGAQQIAMAAMVSDAITHRDAFTDAESAEWSAYSEISAVLGVAPRTSDNRVGEALDLHQRLPNTLAALRAGDITVAKARAIGEETTNLDAPECARVEAKVLPGAAAQKPGALRRKTRAAVERIDSEAVVKRRDRARKEREVITYEQPDGMNAVNAVLPAEDAAAVWAVIDAHAKTLKTSGDERTIGALRADALVDIIVNGNGTPRVAHDVRVIVPVGTVLGLGDEPGYIPGHGPIPAEVVRRIAADAEWQRLLTDPDTGALLDANPTKYRPGDRLDQFIRLRDRHCRWPHCSQPAHRADVDHTVPHPEGPTIRSNLAVFCRHHHQIKQLPGWKVVQGEHGELTFTTPSGRRYRTRPPHPDGTEYGVEEL